MQIQCKRERERQGAWKKKKTKKNEKTERKEGQKEERERRRREQQSSVHKNRHRKPRDADEYERNAIILVKKKHETSKIPFKSTIYDREKKAKTNRAGLQKERSEKKRVRIANKENIVESNKTNVVKRLLARTVLSTLLFSHSFVLSFPLAAPLLIRPMCLSFFFFGLSVSLVHTFTSKRGGKQAGNAR